MNPQVLEKSFKVVNPLGVHARPAAQLVKTANRFQCEVWLRKDDQRVNGKSIMGVLMLAATQGSTLIVEADGSDAPAAVEAIGHLIQEGFGEGRGS